MFLEGSERNGEENDLTPSEVKVRDVTMEHHQIGVGVRLTEAMKRMNGYGFEQLMRRDMIADMAEMLEKTGVKDVNTYDAEYFPGMGIHEMGTARMGRDPKTSVLNGNNQVWDAPNVFVTDGACMTSAGCQNPSLTYMALTARAADFAVRELSRRNL